MFDSGRHAAVKLWDATAGTVTKDLTAEKEFKGNHMVAAALLARRQAARDPAAAASPAA